MNKTFGVIGGDRRQAELARLLAEEGRTVWTSGVAGCPDLPAQAAAADVVILPLPLCREDGILNSETEDLPTSALFRRFSPGQLLLAGQVRPAQQIEAENCGLTLVDYFQREELTVANGGTLVIMCGGEKEVFDEVRPYLLMMGKTATYMGPSGCGSTAKVANNMMVGIHLCAMGEAFAFAKKAGLDPQTLFDAIKGGFAQSAVMDGKVPKLLSRDFSASARIAVHLKDINNAMDVAAHLGVELP